MLPPHEATPCPSSTPSDVLLGGFPRDLQNQLGYEDSTSEIDFTSAFRVLRPVFNRRTTAIRQNRARRPVHFAIHSDDGPEDLQSQRPASSETGAHPRDKVSILAQPAQRPRLKANFLPQNTDAASSDSASAARKCHPIGASLSTNCSLRTSQHDYPNYDRTIEKPARRATVYIPSEDTTMPTMWMGVFSPVKDLNLLDGNSAGEAAADLTGIADQMAQKRGPRKSSVAAAPRRGPLQRARRPPQEKSVVQDVAGQLTGKENLPPDHGLVRAEKVKRLGTVFDISGQSRRSSRPSDVGCLKRPYPTASPERINSVSDLIAVPALSPDSDSGLLQHESKIADEADVSTSPRHLRPHREGNQISGNRKPEEGEKTGLPSLSTDRLEAPLKSAAPARNQLTFVHSYPLLSEDIQNPCLYEDSWLNHQEIAITQLVNNLFDAANGSSRTGEFPSIRSQLLEIYQDRSMVLLQKRLQASLLYGSLCAPKETLTKSSRLGEDLAMKQKFLNLWLNTYDLPALQACSEIVIGRECPDNLRTSAGVGVSHLSGSKNGLRRKLFHFLDTFIIRNEDRNSGNTLLGTDMAGIQRTLLRSLMLIKLLDCVKSRSDGHFGNCLFQPSSQYKSSTGVIEALVQQLLPCAGNVLRSLGHLDYVVNRVQQPLEEYNYQVDNVAVDLRDGVRLTRLVELLLYPSVSETLSASLDADATTAITMPTGDVLSIVQGEPDRPLSQHLKFPCTSRAAKVYNCQIALSALSYISGVNKLVANVQAEHIVDGFREKTMALLWGLASKWGLGSLIDWSDVKREIGRIGGVSAEIDDDGGGEGGDSFAQHKPLLRQWAACAAAKGGLAVTDLSTSFADGRVFEAIVDEYEPFIHASQGSHKDSVSLKGPLSRRLAALGCSQQFASLFSPPSSTSSLTTTIPPIPRSTILNHDFTLASLAFLASRLLSASRPARAALVLHRSWRRVLLRREEGRRVVARTLAEECRLVVQTRDRIAWAKAVIWRAWRRYRGGRLFMQCERSGDGNGTWNMKVRNEE